MHRDVEVWDLDGKKIANTEYSTKLLGLQDSNHDSKVLYNNFQINFEFNLACCCWHSSLFECLTPYPLNVTRPASHSLISPIKSIKKFPFPASRFTFFVVLVHKLNIFRAGDNCHFDKQLPPCVASINSQRSAGLGALCDSKNEFSVMMAFHVAPGGTRRSGDACGLRRS